jgi:hypothetical protein
MPRCLTRNGPATTPVDPGLRGRLALRGGQRQQLVGERLDLALDGGRLNDSCCLVSRRFDSDARPGAASPGCTGRRPCRSVC